MRPQLRICIRDVRGGNDRLVTPRNRPHEHLQGPLLRYRAPSSARQVRAESVRVPHGSARTLCLSRSLEAARTASGELHDRLRVVERWLLQGSFVAPRIRARDRQNVRGEVLHSSVRRRALAELITTRAGSLVRRDGLAVIY
jgi:hypothetical protein